MSPLEREGAVVVIRDWLELSKLQPAKVILALLLAPGNCLSIGALAEAIRPRCRDRRPSDGVVSTTVCYARDALCDLGCADAIIRRDSIFHLSPASAACVAEYIDRQRVAA